MKQRKAMALKALATNQFRLAELMLRDLVQAGDRSVRTQINLGLAILFQLRFWEGGAHLYQVLAQSAPGERASLIYKLSQDLVKFAEQLKKKQNLLGDANDIAALAKVLQSFPINAVQLAGSWVQSMNWFNARTLLVDLCGWLSFAEPQGPISDDDLERLFGKALSIDPSGALAGALAEALQPQIAVLEQEPEAWLNILRSLLSMNIGPSRMFALACHDLFLTRSNCRSHVSFEENLGRHLLLGDSPYNPRLIKLWKPIRGILCNREPDLKERCSEISAHLGAYAIEDAQQLFDGLMQDLLGGEELERLDLPALMALQSSLGFQIGSRSAELELKQQFQQRVTSLLDRRIVEAAGEMGLQPFNPEPKATTDRKLKVGYLCHTVKQHSVGILLDTLVRLQGPDFEIFVYDSDQGRQPDEITQRIKKNAAGYREVDASDLKPAHQAASRIAEDGLDLLVDLDCVTNAAHACIHYFRPAPVSASTMGGEALGSSYVDYFISDGNTLPEGVDEFYVERLARLPRFMYVLEGFEQNLDARQRSVVRKEMGLPDDAVALLVAAPGRKIIGEFRDDVHSIMRRLPQASLLIKGLGNRYWMESFWYKDLTADQQQRIRFLPLTPTKASHRRQLMAADLVLDTYPYNGGTHSFENLWVGNPIVTRPGKTVTSRMAYSMLRNLGIDETIASDREGFVNTAVRLAQDPGLRADIRERLQKAAGERTGIWDAEDLMGDLEQLYRELIGR